MPVKNKSANTFVVNDNSKKQGYKVYFMSDILNTVFDDNDDKYIFDGEYEPTVKESVEGVARSIVPYAKFCVATGGVEIYAKKIDHRVKIFTEWDDEKYMLGRPGDYLAVRKDDLKDVYIIDGDIFVDTYSLVNCE